MTINQQYSPFYNPKTRNIHPIPLASNFYNLLQDRLHSTVSNILFNSKPPTNPMIQAWPTSITGLVSVKLLRLGCR
jgi:hypothetical protein